MDMAQQGRRGLARSAGLGVLGGGWLDMARRDAVSLGGSWKNTAGHAWRGGTRQGAEASGEVWQAWRGRAWHAWARRGLARQASQRKSGRFRQGEAGLGKARPGTAGNNTNQEAK